MRLLFSILLWTAVFLLIVLAIDQLLVRVPANAPAHVAVATFYRDLRARLVDLAKGVKTAPPPTAPAKPVPPDNAKPSPVNVETIIEQKQAQPAPAATAATHRPVAKEPAPRYVYTDGQGELHFADTLAEVPEPYRTNAKVLGE